MEKEVKYGDRVHVIDGFFRGRSGVVIASKFTGISLFGRDFGNKEYKLEELDGVTLSTFWVNRKDVSLTPPQEPKE